MLSAQIRECSDCGSVQDVLKEVNCTLAHYGRNHWLNLSFDSCAPHKTEDLRTLLHYRRILQYKLFNPDWACGIELASIISRVKTLLIRKDCCTLAEDCPFPTADTFEEVSAPPEVLPPAPSR